MDSGIAKLPYDGVRMTPQGRIEMACAWIADDYPHKWLRLVNLCERAMKDGWPRIRRGDLYVLACQQGMSISVAKEYRMDNNLWSVLSRYLIMFRPELSRVIFPKEADIDRCGVALDDAWHDMVAGNTWFPVIHWQNAPALYGGAA